MSTRLPRRLVLAALATLVACALAGAIARADGPAPVDAEVLIIVAGSEPGAFDPALDAMPALKKAPFDTFKSMALHSRKAFRLTDTTPVKVELPNGRQIQLSLLARLPDGRHKVQVSINRPGQKDYLPVLQMIASAEPFFVAGQKFEDKTLVIGVRVGAAAAPAPGAAK